MLMLCWTRAHGDEIAAALLDPIDDLLDGIAVGEDGFGGNVGGFEFLADGLEILFILDYLRADGIRAEGSGGPAVGYVH